MNFNELYAVTYSKETECFIHSKMGVFIKANISSLLNYPSIESETVLLGVFEYENEAINFIVEFKKSYIFQKLIISNY